MAAAVLVPLALVCTRGESLYDGVRLWLVIFPPLALLAGRGAGRLYDRLHGWRPRLAGPAVAGLLALQGVNVVWMSPVWLSSYSAAVGGLWGADRLGFERNYWGDAVTRDLLTAADEQLPAGVPLSVAPTLHQFQERDRAAASPFVRHRRTQWVRDARELASGDLLSRPLPTDAPRRGTYGTPGAGWPEEFEIPYSPAATLEEALEREEPDLLTFLSGPVFEADPFADATEKSFGEWSYWGGVYGAPSPPPLVPTVVFLRRADPVSRRAAEKLPDDPALLVIRRFGVPLAYFSPAAFENAEPTRRPY